MTLSSLQDVLDAPVFERLRQRMAAMTSTYTPTYFREQLPELTEMDVTDEMIESSQIPLIDRLKQVRDCAGCVGYQNCRRPQGMEGLVINLSTYNGYIIGNQSMCGPFHDHLQEKRWEKLQEFSGKAAEDENYSFENFPKRPKDLNFDVCKAVYEFAHHYQPGDKTKGIYLFGKAGTYKTSLMLSMVNRLEERRIPILFIRTDAIFRNFKGYLNRKEPIDPIIEKYCSVQVLAIDEFAQESATEFTIEVMFEIINARFTNGLPTFYTSQYEPDRIYQKAAKKNNLEEKIEAIRRRICQGSRLAPMIGDDWKTRDVEYIGSAARSHNL